MKPKVGAGVDGVLGGVVGVVGVPGGFGVTGAGVGVTGVPGEVGVPGAVGVPGDVGCGVGVTVTPPLPGFVAPGFVEVDELLAAVLEAKWLLAPDEPLQPATTDAKTSRDTVTARRQSRGVARSMLYVSLFWPAVRAGVSRAACARSVPIS
ncbi:MAG TPA: hypothetical protein VFF73_17025 [Planctomycetota bacterium]|nr:hypothetical protein [Planctomycetota bacterium]